MRKLVYVAGPLTTGSETLNTRRAILASHKLMDAAFVPIVPHLCILSDMIQPKDYESWMEYDFGLLEHCNLMVRLQGESPGGSREEEFAKEHNIPIYYSVEELIEKETPEL